ncbi:TetR family transcriptional regulator [Nocardioides sp. YIM 152315]|uniref:TetR family transcriptional regulator n=1 Tax=Nocardioides sp. YIM 152315 TaxID=3031760 RepID=UPI0023DAC223|nr:TetR family transcriptional regulator [Nocardioides sp. YIM 152315]MDF1606377.1 TetR family transcriptional regulator [Nocardioides sp. YIM 152315]
MVASVVTTRRRLVDSAMTLFTEQGFESTSVEDVVARAGTGRTTFFRYFPTKEDVVFPDHDGLLAKVGARLATGTAATARTALAEASAIVLAHYLAEGETARQRYRLTRTVAPLRHRELASVHRYFRLFSGHLRAWLGDEPDAALRAELMASAVITAHNHVLRGWLRGEIDDPEPALASALDRALSRLPDEPSGAPVTVVVTSGSRDVETVLGEVRRALLG